ncbi:MAG: colanic acid biosynthesis glycosyltransferase WcaL, partial [Bacteroidota bacterium]
MSKKIKILFILDGFPSISTPFIINQMIGIVKDGHNLTILSRHKGNLDIIHKEVKNFNLLSKTVFFPPLNESKTARIIYLFKNLHLFFGKHSYKYWNSLNPVKHGKYALSLRLFYETSGFLRLPTLDYDIIHGQFGPLGLMAVRQRRNKTISGRIITQFRGYDISKLFQFEPSNYYNELFKEGDWFLANCNFFAQKAIDKGAPKNKISVQYSGIQTDKFAHPKNDFSINDGLKIVTVGRLAPKKGVKYILQALGQIKQ